jgi:hypothetical protein
VIDEYLAKTRKKNSASTPRAPQLMTYMLQKEKKAVKGGSIQNQARNTPCFIELVQSPKILGSRVDDDGWEGRARKGNLAKA